MTQERSGDGGVRAPDVGGSPAQVASPVDLVVGVLPGAASFILSHGEGLFPGKPRIFLIPGTRNMKKIKGSTNTYTIRSGSITALKTNVERIFSILPTTRHLADPYMFNIGFAQ